MNMENVIQDAGVVARESYGDQGENMYESAEESRPSAVPTADSDLYEATTETQTATAIYDYQASEFI